MLRKLWTLPSGVDEVLFLAETARALSGCSSAKIFATGLSEDVEHECDSGLAVEGTDKAVPVILIRKAGVRKYLRRRNSAIPRGWRERHRSRRGRGRAVRRLTAVLGVKLVSLAKSATRPSRSPSRRCLNELARAGRLLLGRRVRDPGRAAARALRSPAESARSSACVRPTAADIPADPIIHNTSMEQ